MMVGRLNDMDDASGRTSRVIRLARHLELARRDILAARDLDLWEYDVLAALRASGSPYELSPGTLIEQTQVSSGTMTNRIDRLDRRGWVTREPDPDDHRGVRVRLTLSGRRKIDAVAADLAKDEHAAWRRLGERKGAQLDVTVRDLLEQLH
jgi:DNA-binding MarR family transcriptional regulator